MYGIKYCRMIRKHINFLIYMAVMACVVLCAGCADGLFGEDGAQHSARRIELSGEIYQEAVTRIDDNGFSDGDGIGVYMLTIKPALPVRCSRAATVPTMYATLTVQPTVMVFLL